MSWMDSWSRPGKSQATPAPFYALPNGEATPYCHSCGRVIGQRRLRKDTATKIKYCSTRCQGHRSGTLEKRIEDVWIQLLEGNEDLTSDIPRPGMAAKGSTQKSKERSKGDTRRLVRCSQVEDYVFGYQSVSSQGDKHDAKPDTYKTDEGIDMGLGPSLSSNPPGDLFLDDPTTVYIDGDFFARMSVRSGTRIRPAQSVSELNGSVGGERGWAERTEESAEMVEKRRLGQKRAKERELVRAVARRGVVFGFHLGHGDDSTAQMRRKGEAVMSGKVVEPSFAKGDWGLRWRQ